MKRDNLISLMIGVIAGTGIVLGLGTGQPGKDAQKEPAKAEVPKEIRARSFVLVDEKGATRGRFDVLANGDTACVFINQKGEAAVVIGSTAAHGPLISLTSHEGSGHLTLTGTGLVVTGDKDATRLSLGLKFDGTSSVTLCDASGTQHANYAVYPGGFPCLSLFNPDGSDVARFGDCLGFQETKEFQDHNIGLIKAGKKPLRYEEWKAIRRGKAGGPP
jgi:hypothetical protein